MVSEFAPLAFVKPPGTSKTPIETTLGPPVVPSLPFFGGRVP